MRSPLKFLSGLCLCALAGACGSESMPTAASEPSANGMRMPLSEMTRETYLGFEGGLYPGASSAPPAAHAAEGVVRARGIRPLDGDGRPNEQGRYVLISI